MAAQLYWFHTPTYSATDLTTGGFDLSRNAMTANDTRSELGARFDETSDDPARRSSIGWALIASH